MHLTRAELDKLIEQLNRERDSAWTLQVLGLSGKTLTPQEAAQWLLKDRIQRAREVADCSRSKGRPKYY